MSANATKTKSMLITKTTFPSRKSEKPFYSYEQ